MAKQSINKVSTVKILSWDEVPDADKRLLELAVEARKSAVAPYSHYRVGSAILWRSGHMSRGCNIENCVYEVLHGEKGAISDGIINHGLDKIERVAVVGAPEGQEVVIPEPISLYDLGQIPVVFADACVSCGQCLQDILEFSFGDPDIVMSMIYGKVVLQSTLGELLPVRFGPWHLGVDYANLLKK